MAGQQIGLTRDNLEKLYWRLRLTPGGRLRSPIYPWWETRESKLQHFVTTLRLGTDCNRYVTGTQPFLPLEHTGICNIDDVAGLLGIPKLPRTNTFAYSVKSNWALKSIKRAIKYGAEALKPLENATVLEELFIV